MNEQIIAEISRFVTENIVAKVAKFDGNATINADLQKIIQELPDIASRLPVER